MLVKPAAARRTPSRRNWSRPCEEASIAAWVTPLSASSASRRCRVIGSGVVWLSRAETAPSTPTVPKLTAVSPSASQIWRVKEATEVLPLVPVTATITSGWSPYQRLAAIESARRGWSCRITGTASGPGGLGDGEAGGIGQDRGGAGGERGRDEGGAVGLAAGERREQMAGLGLAAVDREAGQLGQRAATSRRRGGCRSGGRGPRSRSVCWCVRCRPSSLASGGARPSGYSFPASV